MKIHLPGAVCCPPVARRTADMSGVAPYALDPGNAGRLWEESLRLLG